MLPTSSPQVIAHEGGFAFAPWCKDGGGRLEVLLEGLNDKISQRCSRVMKPIFDAGLGHDYASLFISE